MKNNLYFALIILFLLLISTTGMGQAAPNFTIIYVIQEGDTLFDIAMDYGVSVKSILNVNGISEDRWIKLGQELVIPRVVSEPAQGPDWNKNFFNQDNSETEALSLNVGSNYSVRINPEKKLPEVNIPDDKIIEYHVGVGDTLFDLARSLNTSIGVIMALNEMEDGIIRVGQKIKLPIHNLTPRQALARTVNQEDIDLLARAIYGEARGEPFIGQVAVGAVIINRVLSSYFPDSFYRVIHQKNQFSAVADGQFYLSPNNTAYRAAREALRGTDPTMGSMYYYNPKTAKNQWWFSTRRMMVTIGDHVFAK